MTDLEQAYNERLKELEAENKRLRAPWLCDCHTWPGPDEMHAYVEALEKLLVYGKANS